MTTSTDRTPAPTVEDEAERLLSYWHQHGNDPEVAAKFAVSDLLAFVRLAAPDAAAHYGAAPWETADVDPDADKTLAEVVALSGLPAAEIAECGGLPGRLAYYAQDGIPAENGPGFEVVIVEDGVAGYSPTGYTRPTVDEARALAASLNADLGISEDRMNAIVSSSMAASFRG